MATVTALVVVIAACGEDKNATLPDGLDTSTDNKEGADNNPDGTGSQDGAAESPYPALPSVLSLSGCDAVGFGPLCSLTQNESKLRVNCGGSIFDGTVSEIGDVTFASASSAVEGGPGPLSCKGRFIAGQVSATCSRTGVSGQEETCNVVSDRQILPGVTCLELPSQLESVTVCASGNEKGGKTIQAGTCKVIQDGCIFQAECENDYVFTGTVSRTGVSFSQQLVALEDAQTPANGGDPAFLKGQVVAHACSAELNGTTLTGSCGAGASGRGSANTSVCAVTGKATSLPPTCGPLSDASEKLFALDSCDMLREGGGPNEPGIGQPVCAFRQNNCIWEVNCGNDPLMTFSGRSTPGASRVEWRLLTGTPCEASFDAAGNISGSCTVPGQPACAIGNLKTPTPGSASCPSLPLGTNFTTHGCAGVGIDCRLALQHECDFMAICTYSERFPDVVIAGTSSYVDGRPHLSFNGLADYKCYVEKATETEISSGDRQDNEWYGQCTNSIGGQCRDNYNPATKSGFRGLRLYFGDQGN